MFMHNYIYRMKCNIRDRELMFWTIAFPIILATLFYMGLSNITSAEKFTGIKIAIISNAEYEENTAFQEAIKAVSTYDGNTAGGNGEKSSLFDVKYTSREEGDRLLANNEIEGYIIYFDEGIKLVVRESGLSETIIKGFIEDFIQTSSTVETIIGKDPGRIQTGLLDDISQRSNYLKEVAVGKAAPDIIVNYFYALLAMACMYGGFWGLKEVIAVQADLSYQGERVNVAPTHKLKVFIVATLAAATVQFFEVFALLAYMIFILNIDFGNQIGYIILTCVIGTITGITFGAFIVSTVKGKEGTRIGIFIGSTMLMSFLSGMMYDKMKYIISTNVPILGYLNPAGLITDCFYSLYYYDNYTRFFTNITILCGFIAVFSLSTYYVLRRQKYASL